MCRHAHSLLPFVSRRTVPITIPVRVLCTIIIEERSTVADDRQTDSDSTVADGDDDDECIHSLCM